MTAHICVWRTQVAGSNWSADVVREPGRAKPAVKAFTTTSSSSFSVGEPRLSRKGVSSFRSEGLENLTPAVPAATKEEARGSSSEDERDQTHHSGGRGGGTMASLIKRFRESPPLSKADRSSEEGRGDKSLPGFWWREESRRHIEGGLDTIVAKEEEPAAQDVRGEEDEDNQGPASDDGDEGGSGRDALLRDLEAVLDVGEGEDILQAWRERNRHLLLRRGLLQQEQLEEEMAAEEAVVGEEAEPPEEWDGGVGRIPVAVTREGGYRTFIDKLRRRLGMFEDDYGAAANDGGGGQAEGEELEGEELEVDAASDSEETLEVGEDEDGAPDHPVVAGEDEGRLECAPPTVVPSTPVEVEPLIDQVVLERLFCGGPAEEGGGSEEKALSPTALLKDQRYDSDKVVLMLKERILSLQRSMDEDVLGRG